MVGSRAMRKLASRRVTLERSAARGAYTPAHRPSIIGAPAPCGWEEATVRPHSTLCRPSRSSLRTGGKREKAVFG
jgi:hypothetical protein